jgi:TetR/AcrR family transcriptional regulator, cholesterol catabolism regulator
VPRPRNLHDGHPAPVPAPAPATAPATATATAPPPVPAPAPTPADLRRGAIIDLAAELFDRHGYGRVSMEQIATAAGVAKPTLYHYFRGKDEILRGIHESFIDLLLDRQRERHRLGLAPADLLLGAMTDILGLMETRRGHVRVFFEHHRELPPAVRDQIRVKRDRYQNMIRQAVEEGIRRGQFRDLDAGTATLAIFGMCNWAYQWWRPAGGADSAHTAQKMWDLVMRGLRTDPR